MFLRLYNKYKKIYGVEELNNNLYKYVEFGNINQLTILLCKNGLPPRILVQVKSQYSDIGEATIRSLKGAMREGDYGLFVTLSNYTKYAQKYLDSTPIIRGINGTELVDLILKYYNDLSDKYKRLVPLKMVYIPVVKEA